MKQRSFSYFTDKKKRETVEQLKLIKKLLEANGFKVESFVQADYEGNDPYIFCHNDSKDSSFQGIRIYKIGDSFNWRIQKESKSHPFGSAYPLPIESMFYDFMSDDGIDEKKAGKKVIEAVGKEIHSFFQKSAEAERKNFQDDNIDKAGNVNVRGVGTDYAAMVQAGMK